MCPSWNIVLGLLFNNFITFWNLNELSLLFWIKTTKIMFDSILPWSKKSNDGDFPWPRNCHFFLKFTEKVRVFDENSSNCMNLINFYISLYIVCICFWRWNGMVSSIIEIPNCMLSFKLNRVNFPSSELRQKYILMKVLLSVNFV